MRFIPSLKKGIWWASMLLVSCTTLPTNAPVYSINDPKINAGALSNIHRVIPGETLFSIAFQSDKTVPELAALNGLRPPYRLRVGQTIRLDSIIRTARLSPPKMKIVKKTTILQKKRIKNAKKLSNLMKRGKSVAKKRTKGSVAKWVWPTNRGETTPFDLSKGHKGVDIYGKSGQIIRASQNGIVVYSGSGLRSYGNLLIIKHENDYLSAYAHNKVLLVKEGEKVKANEPIAKMGKTGSKRVKLHFEIRRRGRPKDPLKLLLKG